MMIKLLFEGESDQTGHLQFFREELKELDRRGIEVRTAVYGGRSKGFTRRIPRKIQAALHAEMADAVIAQVDSERDTDVKMMSILQQMNDRLLPNEITRTIWVVTKRCLESVLLAGCFEKDRNYETILEPKDKVKELFKQRLHKRYIETIHGPEYMSQISKQRVLSRISGMKVFQNALLQFLETP
jgi:hypothetical protein